MLLFNPQTKTINITLLNGGVGDHMASFVAIDYILRKYPWITPLIWMPDLLVDLAKNLLPDHTQINSFTSMRGRYTPERPTKSTTWDGHTSPMKIHSLDYAFLKLCDESPPIEEKNYLKIRSEFIDVSKFSLPKNFIVITCGFTVDVREFKPKFVNEIVQYIKSKDIVPVFLGNSRGKTGLTHEITANFAQDIDFSQGLNFINQTTLSEAAAIMNLAKAVVGIDNGLLHVAGCTDTAIVGGFTTVSPQIRMPVRRNILGWNYFPVVPDNDLHCKFCQQDTNFIYGHNYVNCLYKNKPGYQYRVNLCTTQMNSEKFIVHLEKILND